MTQAAAAEPVPSVLPEGGIDLGLEIERYRQWFIEQALIQTNGNIIAAGKLLGFKHKTSLYRLLRQREQGGTFRMGAAAHRANVQAAAPAEELAPPPAAPISGLEVERRLAKLMQRVDWARVAELRGKGLDDWRIAQRLAGALGCNRILLQKALQRRREPEAASVPWEHQP